MFWPFGRKKQTIPLSDFSDVITDMHSHLIPGIDDGSPDLETSIALVKDLHALGFRKIITTPHIMSDFYKNTPEIILGGVEKVKSALAKEHINIEIQAAAEYYVDDGFLDLVEEKQVLTFGDNYVLIEFSYINPPENLKEIIFQIETNGYKPILAHPERYSYWSGNMSKFRELKERGVLLQCNINSFGGYYGSAARKTAMQLSDDLLVDFLGSDTHNKRHVAALHVAIHNKALQELIHSKTLKNRKL